MGSGQPEDGGHRLLNDVDLRSSFLMALAAAAVAHLAVFVLLTPGALPPGFPVHHDDFNNLGYTSPVWTWTLVRPLSTFFLTCLSSLGIETFYLALHLLIVLYQALVLTAVCQLLRVPRPVFLLFLGAALPAQAFEYTAEVFLYTGLVTNLLSGVLGTTAICFLIAGVRDPAARSKELAAGVGLYAAALFAKEDFVLPVLLVFGWEAYSAWRRSRRLEGRVWLAGGILLFFPAAHVLASKFLSSGAFFLSTHPAYRPVLKPGSLVKTLSVYLFTWRGSIAICLLGLTATIVWVVLRREGLGRAAVTALVPFAIMAPYLMLPLHVSHYYSFFWICWISALGLGLGWLRVFPNGSLWSGAAIAGLLLASALTLRISRWERSRILRWYSELGDLNRRVVATVARSREAISGKRVVGVTGVPDFNPWFYTDAGFLKARLGLSCRWEIFVPDGSAYYRAEVLDPNRPIRPSVVTRGLSELPAHADLPFLRLLPDGGVAMEVLGGGLNPPSKGRITGWVDGNGFFPGDQICVEGTLFPPTAFGNSSWLTFELAEAEVANHPTLRVEVVRPGARTPKHEVVLQRH